MPSLNAELLGWVVKSLPKPTQDMREFDLSFVTVMNSKFNVNGKLLLLVYDCVSKQFAIVSFMLRPPQHASSLPGGEAPRYLALVTYVLDVTSFPFPTQSNINKRLSIFSILDKSNAKA